MFNKFYNSILCSVIGDIIGYGNGHVEFNDNTDMKINSPSDINRLTGWSVRHVITFITLGCIENYDFKHNIVSDDTYLLLANLDALIKTYNKDNDVILEEIKNKMIQYYENDDKKNVRNYGIKTVESLMKIKNGYNWRKIKYDSNGGGSGASMRCMPIGLIYHGKKNREKLIYLAIMSSIITHTNPIGYLGGLVSALYSAFAIEGINKNKWPELLFKIFDSDYFNKIISKINSKFPEYKKKQNYDIQKFIIWWKSHYNIRFKNKKFIDVNQPTEMSFGMRYFDIRSKFYYDNYTRKGYLNPGSNGCDSTIIAYDAFMDAKCFFSFICYSMLHCGDSDTTGCIAGALYGAYNKNIKYDFNINDIECIDLINELTNKAKFIFTQ